MSKVMAVVAAILAVFSFTVSGSPAEAANPVCYTHRLAQYEGGSHGDWVSENAQGAWVSNWWDPTGFRLLRFQSWWPVGDFWESITLYARDGSQVTIDTHPIKGAVYAFGDRREIKKVRVCKGFNTPATTTTTVPPTTTTTTTVPATTTTTTTTVAPTTTTTTVVPSTTSTTTVPVTTTTVVPTTTTQPPVVTTTTTTVPDSTTTTSTTVVATTTTVPDSTTTSTTIPVNVTTTTVDTPRLANTGPSADLLTNMITGAIVLVVIGMLAWWAARRPPR